MSVEDLPFLHICQGNLVILHWSCNGNGSNFRVLGFLNFIKETSDSIFEVVVLFDLQFCSFDDFEGLIRGGLNEN